MQGQERQGHRTRTHRQLRTQRTHPPTQLEHELLTLINKRVVTLSSYWHQKDLIGVGVWYCSRAVTNNNSSRPSSRNSKENSANKLSNRGTRLATSPRKQEENNEYYQT